MAAARGGPSAGWMCGGPGAGTAKDGVRTWMSTRAERAGDETTRALRCDSSAPRRRVSATHASTCTTQSPRREYATNVGPPPTHTCPFNGPLSGTTRVSRYQKGKTYLDFTEARDSEWQWHQLGHMQVCTSLQIQTDNHTSTPPLSFLQAGCPS